MKKASKLVTLVQLTANLDAMMFLMEFLYYRKEEIQRNRIY